MVSVFDGRTMPMKGANLGDNSESAMVAASLRGIKGSLHVYSGWKEEVVGRVYVLEVDVKRAATLG